MRRVLARAFTATKTASNRAPDPSSTRSRKEDYEAKPKNVGIGANWAD
jgi:hypothetical protein